MSDKTDKLPNLRSYRKLRFSMYNQVMKESKDIQNACQRKTVFDKWSDLCMYDMTKIEMWYLTSCLQIFFHDKKVEIVKLIQVCNTHILSTKLILLYSHTWNINMKNY